MKRNTSFLVVIVGLSFFLLTGFVKDAADIFAGLSMITDTVTDINDAVLEEELVAKQVDATINQQREIESALRELDYTQSEINDILGADSGGSNNTLFVLQRAAQNIKRAKELIKRLKTAGQINPDVATAGYTAMSAKSLTDIKLLLAQVIYNQNRDYQDRVLERAKEKSDWAKTKKMIHSARINLTSDDGKNSSRDLHQKSSPLAPAVVKPPPSISGKIKTWWQEGMSH